LSNIKQKPLHAGREIPFDDSISTHIGTIIMLRLEFGDVGDEFIGFG